MPIDINLLRVERGGDPEKVRESQRRRFASVDLVDEVISIDEIWRRLTGKQSQIYANILSHILIIPDMRYMNVNIPCR